VKREIRLERMTNVRMMMWVAPPWKSQHTSPVGNSPAHSRLPARTGPFPLFVDMLAAVEVDFRSGNPR
jgi:hypothetical protein